jgi:membrane-associated phospholipid phosphatase
VDAAGNACPSLHVASAVFSLCWMHRILAQLRAPRVLQWLSAVQCVAIVWSTMATLQHVALDVFAGVVVGLAFAAASLAHVKNTA